MKVNFNRSILSFLKANGYTHILNAGMLESDVYYLLYPLKTGDARFEDKAINERIDNISSNEVFDMADGVEFISFLIILSTEELEQYKITLR